MMDPRQTGKDPTDPASRFIAKANERGLFHRIIIALLSAIMESGSIFTGRYGNVPTTEMPSSSLDTVLRHAEQFESDDDPDPLPSFEELEKQCLQWDGDGLLVFRNERGRNLDRSSRWYRIETEVTFHNMLHA